MKYVGLMLFAYLFYFAVTLGPVFYVTVKNLQAVAQVLGG